MTILHKDGDGVTNWDNVARLARAGCYIIAYMVDGSSHHIGRYESQEDAKAVFDSLYKKLERKYG